jgi:two-component system chemotaxis sensor kinase CheA
MEAGDADPELINGVFRAVHSIKGGAGAFNLDSLVRFAHVFETALDEMRSGRLAPRDDVVKLMLRASDVLADEVRAARDGGEIDEARSLGMVEELRGLGPEGGEAETDDGGGLGDFEFRPVAFGADDGAADAAPEGAGDAGGWTVVFTPRADLYAKANETALMLRELGSLGEIEVTLDTSRLPPLDQMDPEASYLSWTIRLASAAGEAAIREVFEFVDGDCELVVSGGPALAEPTFASELAAEMGLSAAPDLDIAALLAKVQGAAEQASEPALPSIPLISAQAKTQEHPLASASGNEPAPTTGPRLRGDERVQKGEPTGGSAPAGATIRVDLDRVDRLIDLVGELVINQAMLSQRVLEAGLTRVSGVAMGLDELEQLTRQIQDSVMAIRAQPVKSVFQRMPRLVREVAMQTGKPVRLVTEGEATEVDKTVIERLADPLTHMIRNAIDHGLENPARRAAAGKPPEGVVRLSAAHRSGRVVIEVGDDGGGIDRARVKSIAAERGLIAPDAPLSDDEIDNLIFLPGFSTASEISDISGRGVGMDVVRRSIQALGGRISIASRPGQGSTFTMSLPLTLAVLDGMVVSVAGQTLVAPITAIIETLQPKAADVHALGGGAYVINIRDTYVPLIDVGCALGYRARPAEASQGVALLIEGEGGARAALLVDGIQGQRQVVIKSLEANYRQIPGVAAATILGDGRVALILDIDTIVAVSRGENRKAG